MKFLGFIVVTKFLSISCFEPKYKLAPVLTSCPLLLPVDNYSQTVFFDMDVHPPQEIKTGILRNIVSKQSVLLLNRDVNIKVNVRRGFILTNNNPNVILTTKYLTPKMFNSTLWRIFIRSNWSLLYIIVTGERKFKCENGTMTQEDFLELDNIMNTLWHRFQIMRVGVVFSFACKQKMVIYNGKRPSARMLYDRSIKLINATNYDELYVAIKKSGEKLAHDYPMLAGLFYRYPTSINDCENLHYYVHFNLNLTLGFCGLDGMVLHDILSHLKFNVSFCQDEKCNYYGYESHGNVSGALGCIIHNELDISFNSRFITQYANERLYYLHYVTTDTLCAFVKKPDIVPLWHGVFNLFSPSLWALIGAVLVAIGGIMWATAIINKTITGAEIMPFWCYLQNSVITTMLGNSPMKTRTMLTLRSACLLGSVFFLAIYQKRMNAIARNALSTGNATSMCTGYATEAEETVYTNEQLDQGHISRVFTTVERFKTIKTLKELYRSEAFLYTSASTRKIMRSLQTPGDKLQEKFFDRAFLTDGNQLGVILTNPCAATIDRKSDAKMSILEQYSDNQGTPLIDIVDECFYTYYLSYIARPGFPFVEDICKITERLNEAGLPKIYYKWTQQMLEIRKWRPENNSEPRAFSKIRLRDQYVAFGILFAGITVSVIVFAAEMWIGKRQHLKLLRRS